MYDDTTPDISILVCTFRRTHLLPNLLRRLAAQEKLGSLTTEIVVVDNCPDRSAAEVVAKLATEIPFLHYVAEPRPGISNARNTGIRNLRGQFFAFIDDDEITRPDWLHHLLKTQKEHGADVVFGPVLPIFVKPVESYPRLYEAAFTQSSDASTGAPVERKKLLWFLDRRQICTRPMATNNALIKRDCFFTKDQPFNPALGLCGGEDTVFFAQLGLEGRRMIWCREAVVEEFIPPERTNSRYVLRYRYRSGQTTSFTCVMTRPRRVGALMRFMAAGFIQAALYGTLALAFAPANRERSLGYLWAAVGGVGKIFWSKGFRVQVYGRSPNTAVLSDRSAKA